MKTFLTLAACLGTAVTAHAGYLGMVLVSTSPSHSVSGTGSWSAFAGVLDAAVLASQNTQGKMPEPGYGTLMTLNSDASASISVTVRAYWYSSGVSDPPPSTVQVYTSKSASGTSISTLMGTAAANSYSVTTSTSSSPGVTTNASVSYTPSTALDGKSGFYTNRSVSSVTWHATAFTNLLESDQTWTYSISASTASEIRLPLPYTGGYMQGNSLSASATTGTIYICPP